MASEIVVDVVAATSASAVAASLAAVTANVVGIKKADFAIAAIVFADVVTLALAFAAPVPKTSDIAATTCGERRSSG